MTVGASAHTIRWTAARIDCTNFPVDSPTCQPNSSEPPKGSGLKRNHAEFTAAIAVAIIGAVLYFREDTTILGYGIPHYTGLILVFCGVLWIFYSLFANR